MNTPKSRDWKLVLQESEKELLIYDLNNHKAFMLNETSAIIWRMCDGKTTFKQINEQLANQLKKTIGEEIIWLALDDFQRNNLLAGNEQLKIEFGGLSRREVIRKVGLASMIALPLISNLIAPTATHAQSGLAINVACTSNGQCQSGNCQGGINPQRCCVAGNTNNLAPGQAIGCDPGCTSATTNVCCSNSVSVGPDLAFCNTNGFPPGSSCYCSN